MREILSLQFGHYSNFIGTHWWNIQETGFNYSENSISEINHNVLYREGTTNKGEVTFTPRVLLADLKGSLKTLSKHGDLYETVPSNPAVSTVVWPDNQVEVLVEEKLTKNSFQQAIEKDDVDFSNLDTNILNDEVTVWSDFLYSRFHPRTVNIIKEYEHESSTNEFDVFPLGTSLWHTQFSEEFTDKIRNYIEECDSLQGFHMTVDAINAFGALASSCLEYLKDEFDKKSILVFAAIPSYYSDYNFTTAEQREISTKKDSIRLTNLALCLQSLTENSSLVVPLCTGSQGWRQPGPKREFNHVSYNPELPYHTSAIIASALDTLTLIYRTKTTEFTINDFCVSLNTHGRKIAAASLCLPFGMKREVDLIDCLDNWDGPLWQNLTPKCDIGSDKLMQVISTRGILESRLKRPVYDVKAKKQREMPAYKCNSVQEMLSFYLSCTGYDTASHVSSLETPMSVKTPYPNIFDDYIGSNGDILDTPRSKNQFVNNIPVIAGCHSGAVIGDTLEILHREASRIKIARFHRFTNAGLESDEYKEILDKLQDLRGNYEDNYI